MLLQCAACCACHGGDEGLRHRRVRRALDAFAGAVDRLNGGLGRVVAWLTLAMVLVGAFNATVRYLGRFTGADLASNAYIELQWYLFSALFLLGAADALRQDAHVRVDVAYGRFPKRVQGIVDLFGTFVFLLPFCILAIATSLPAVEASWAIYEQSPDPGGLARYPIKTLIPICFVLVALQGLAQAVRAWSRARGRDDGDAS